MSRPVLYIFAISHYCEKARWALDYLEIDHAVCHLPPGLHMSIASKLGAPGSSVPILVADGQVVQGSAEIIDWADSAVSGAGHCLTPTADREVCLEIEKRLGAVAGVHVRRYYYSEAIIEHPETVRPIFSRGLSIRHKLALVGSWGMVRKSMIRYLRLGREQGQESMRIVDAELAWLDELLADGRRFLAGDQFSRADLTAASLFAPLVLPAEHPTYARLNIPPRMAADVMKWEGRPSMQWVRDTYRDYRYATATD